MASVGNGRKRTPSLRCFVERGGVRGCETNAEVIFRPLLGIATDAIDPDDQLSFDGYFQALQEV